MENGTARSSARPWRSIRVRFTLLYVATLGMLLTAAAIVLYVTAEEIVIRETDEALATRASAVIDAYAAGEDYLDIGVVQDLQFHVGRVYPDYFYYGLFLRSNPASNPLLSTTAKRSQHATDDLTLAASGRPGFAFLQFFHSRMRVLSLQVPKTGRILVMATPWDPNEYRLKRLTGTLTALMAVVLAAAGTGCYLLIERTLSPIGALVSEAERLSVERMRPELLPERAADTEIDHLVKALNGMVSRIHTALNSQRQFAADASHELRTPLTILRGELELALQRERTAAEYRAVLESGLEETERLTAIVEALGILARGDASEWRSADYTTVELNILLRDLVLGFQPASVSAGIALSYHANGPTITLQGDRDALRRALSNVIENALRFTQPGGVVKVFLLIGYKQARIEVLDTGVGIDPSDIGRLFDRFFRSARTRGMQEGSGLGLAIASRIIHAHGGEIEVRSVVGEGSVFTVRLPQ